MMFASTSVITFAIGITAVLMIANWFIWGLNNPRDLRHPSTVTPLSGRELVGRAFGRAAARHQTQATARDKGDNGFRHVA